MMKSANAGDDTTEGGDSETNSSATTKSTNRCIWKDGCITHVNGKNHSIQFN